MVWLLFHLKSSNYYYYTHANGNPECCRQHFAHCCFYQPRTFVCVYIGVEKVVREDTIIRDFGIELLGRLGTADERRTTDLNNVKTKLRSVARLVTRIRTNTGTTLDLNGYLSPKHFSNVVKASKDLAAVSPQLTIALGHYVRSAVLLKLSFAIGSENMQMRREAEDFKTLMEAHWKSQVSTVTRRRQKLRHLNKDDELPDTEDLVTFSQYLKNKIQSASTGEEDMAKLCLAQLILFNKRRPLEVSELKKADFKLISRKTDANREVLASLTQTERMLATR